MATRTIRQATPDDAPELARLLDLFDHMGATPEQVAARMLACQNVLTTFIGEMDGRPVGFACLRLIPHLQGDEPYAGLCQDWEHHGRSRRAKPASLSASRLIRRPSARSSALSSGLTTPVVAPLVRAVLAAWWSASASIAVAQQR